MKNKTRNTLRTTFLAGAVLLASVPFSTQTILAESSTQNTQTISAVPDHQQDTKYPKEVMKVVRKYLGVKQNSTELDTQINAMIRSQVMDIVVEYKDNKAKGKAIRKIVNDVYNISLDTISENGEGSLLKIYPTDIMEGVRKTLNVETSSTELDSKIMSMPKSEVMDKFFHSYGKEITGSESRRVINEIFGVNLSGIDSLEKARLSLFSKGQWMTKNSTDVFVIVTGKGDVDARVGVSDYYIQKTGTDQFPVEISDALTSLGFTYEGDTNTYYYVNPTGESVPDSFKGQWIGKLVTYIQNHSTEF